MRSLKLPESLRAELKIPLGALIEGTIEETSPILKKMLENRNQLLVGVGDVTADLLISLNLEPEMVITDGKTKRSDLDEWKDYENYRILEATNPAAEISTEAWDKIKEALKLIQSGEKIHLKINGEEDLLVIPLIAEFPLNSKIIYGQPNVGSVVRVIDTTARANTQYIIDRMEKI